MKKRLWSILLTACLLVGLLPTVALAAEVKYQDDAGVEQTCETATKVTSGSSTVWGNGEKDNWYVAQDNVTIDSGVTISGDVCLILADG